MSTVAIRLNEELIQVAKSVSAANFRSLPKQVEYWAMMGHIGEENPDLPFHVIQGILQGLEEYKAGLAEPYDFENDK